MLALRRDIKIDIIWAVFGGICTLIFCAIVYGCGNETVLQGGLYAGNLEDCNKQAKNLCDSIACENHYRLAAGRLPRDVPAHCSIKDAGVKETGSE